MTKEDKKTIEEFHRFLNERKINHAMGIFLENGMTMMSCSCSKGEMAWFIISLCKEIPPLGDAVLEAARVIIESKTEGQIAS